MTRYEELQDAAVRRFLRTAVVVDDEAVTEMGDAASNEKASGAVDVKVLADLFADAGITCGILKPSGEAGAVERMVTAAARTDLVIIDWWIDDKSGDNALAAIEGAVRENQHGRRVVAVYTTQRDLGKIEERIRTRLDLVDAEDEPELRITAGGTRIVILNKGLVAVSPEYEEHHVATEALPEHLISEFRDHASGLVPAVALNALAAARENTHRVLNRLDRELDLGYAGHLLRIEHAGDGAGHLIDALADELRAAVEDDERTRTAAGEAGFHAWLADRVEALSVDKAIVDDLVLANTADRAVMDRLKEKHPLLKKRGEAHFTEFLTEDADKEAAQLSDARFAMLLSLRHGWRLPSLRLGTVVLEETTGRYWLCVQPVCDSVRLPGAVSFPLLRLEKWPEHAPKQRFHIVVPAMSDGEPPLRLWAATRPQDLHLVSVRPTRDGVAEFDEVLELECCDDVRLRWLGQLKFAHAQRIAANLGHWMSRVGLDESEWLRQRGQTGKEPEDSRVSGKTAS